LPTRGCQRGFGAISWDRNYRIIFTHITALPAGAWPHAQAQESVTIELADGTRTELSALVGIAEEVRQLKAQFARLAAGAMSRYLGQHNVYLDPNKVDSPIAVEPGHWIPIIAGRGVEINFTPYTKQVAVRRGAAAGPRRDHFVRLIN